MNGRDLTKAVEFHTARQRPVCGAPASNVRLNQSETLRFPSSLCFPIIGLTHYLATTWYRDTMTCPNLVFVHSSGVGEGIDEPCVQFGGDFFTVIVWCSTLYNQAV